MSVSYNIYSQKLNALSVVMFENIVLYNTGFVDRNVVLSKHLGFEIVVKIRSRFVEILLLEY